MPNICLPIAKCIVPKDFCVVIATLSHTTDRFAKNCVPLVDTKDHQTLLTLIHSLIIRSLAMAETETSRHVYQPVEALAAYYTSPTFSQIHRESLTPNGNSAANQLTNTPVEPEFYIQHNWHDPFNAAATIWARAPGILQTSPGDGISDPRCLDSFPFSIHAAADGSFWENGYPHLLRSTPFLVDEGNSSVVPPSDRPPSISTGTTFTPQAQVIPTTVTGNQQQKMTVGFKTSQDRKPARRRMKKSKHVRKPYRKPSPAELARCETGRKSSALEVFYQRINELVDYKLETGDCNVPQKYEPNRALGVW